MNGTGTGEISDLDCSLFIFPHAIYPVFTNGGTTDAEQKVKTALFM